MVKRLCSEYPMESTATTIPTPVQVYENTWEESSCNRPFLMARVWTSLVISWSTVLDWLMMSALRSSSR